MNSHRNGARPPACRTSYFTLNLSLLIILLLASIISTASSQAAKSAIAEKPVVTKGTFSQQGVSPADVANDTCATARVISPASLPFAEDSSTDTAINDLDPGAGGCAPGAGPDAVYSFTPAETDTYTVGATPFGTGFDLSLYILTDCSNAAATCVAGANNRGLAKGEVITATLTAGTQYFIVVDGVQPNASGPFHFSLRRGTPANEACASAAVIDPSRLPFAIAATTFGATNDLNPGTPCVRNNETANGPDVVFQFTPVDTQAYIVTLTPIANYDATLYIVTGCPALSGCSSSQVGGNGDAESIRRVLTAGTTYFIVVDGFRGDAGDFTLTLEPSIPLAPPAPSNLVATVVAADRVDLTWVDNSGNELGFRIERSLNGFDFAELATVGANVTSFSDTTVFADTTFFYRVLAFNNFGNSEPSNVAAATTPRPSPPQAPVINVAPASIDFGSVRATQDSTRTITIRNAGGVDLQINNIIDPLAPFSIVNKPSLPLTIAPNESVDITVRFAPTAVGQFVSALTILSNDPVTPAFTVTLSGLGVGAPVPNLEFSPGSINFTGGSGSMTFEVRNTGDADLFISSVTRPGAPFFVTGGPAFPTTLRPGESFFFTISFSPAAPGVFSSALNIVSNDPDQLLTVIPLRGTSTPQNELLKLRAPTLVTAVAGTTTTLNVLAVNGTNTNIQLSATSIPFGLFTDRGNGRGDLVLMPSANTSGRFLVTFTATDTANTIKTLQSVINVAAASDTHRVQITWVAPETASNPPTNVLANDLSLTALAASINSFESHSLEPAVAAGLVGYVVYRSDTAGVPISLSNIVGVALATQTSFTDTVPAPPNSPQVFFYRVTALYQTGTESVASNETSTAPRLVGLEFKKKRIRFRAANSNVAVGAVLIVDGRETFVLTRDGDFIIVNKNARSTPGNLRARDIFDSGSHTIQVRNPNGTVSAVQTLSR